MVTPFPGLPPKPSGKRRSGEVSEFRPGGRNEGCGACDDAAMQEQGVSKILTINLNDMAKELNIK